MNRPSKYLLICADLLRRVNNGEFAPGDALPAQRTLSKEYGVSLMTLRNALDELCGQGVVEPLPGKGTYVSVAPVPYSMGNLRSLADDLRARGIEVLTRVLSAEIVPVPDERAARLGIPTEGGVLRLERVRIIRGTPLIHQLSYIPQPLAGRLAGIDFAEQELYTALAERADAVAARAEETISPILMPEHIGELLGLPAGQPAMRSERITRDTDERTLVIDLAVLAGSGVVIMNTRAVRGHQVSYAMEDPCPAPPTTGGPPGREP